MSENFDIGHVPPYGFINAEYVADSTEIPVPMGGNSAMFDAMVNGFAKVLADKVWPMFSGGSWVGNAVGNAIALTRADLAVGHGLARYLPTPISSPDAVARANTHLQFFKEEDCFTPDPKAANPSKPFFPWGANFPQYAASTPWLASKLAGLFDDAGVAESGALDLRLKVLMQRPRPYQMTLLFGEPSYIHQSALSSQTPSLVSGHALQSTIAGCFVAKEFAVEFAADPRLRDCWAQFMIDVGDRRVFAGVHYPSDSLASWYCALKFAGRFYGTQIRDFLWDAITNKSRVYADVVCHAGTVGSPYANILAWLAETAVEA